MAPNIPDMPPQVVQAYKDACDNLIYLKKEEFQVTFYTWLLLAALYVLARDFAYNGKLFLCAGAISVGVLSVVVLRNFQIGIERFRDRLNHIYGVYFTPQQKGDLELDATTTHRTVVRVLYAACIIASGFTVVAIYLSPLPKP